MQPGCCSTAADVARLLVCWLALILFVQGIGAAQALGRGPLHRHVEGIAGAAHLHGASERHHHSAHDLSVTAVAEQQDPAFDAGAFALAAALALMAVAAMARVWPDLRCHVWRRDPVRAWHSHVPAPLLQPPRKG